MGMARIIIFVLWEVITLLVTTQAAMNLAQLDASKGSKFFALVIFVIFAPIFCAYSALENLLDMILPPGWEDDDDERRL